MTEIDRLVALTRERFAAGARQPWPGPTLRGIAAGTAPRVTPPSQLARLIDHTLLKPEATADEIVQLCDDARRHGFASVCVNSMWVPLAAARLAGSDVMVCAVVGFPLGAMAPPAKAYEAKAAVQRGAREIDMVLPIGALAAGDHETVFDDIRGVVEAAAPAAVKVILETSALDTEHKIVGCALAKLAGAAFVKTSTGFGKAGATVEDVALMRQVVGPELGVKASGGIRTADDVRRMVAAGANRIGASASVAIVTGAADPSAKGY